MRMRLWGMMFALWGLSGTLAAQTNVSPLPRAEQITGVWNLVEQSCEKGSVIRFDRYKGEAQVVQSGRLDLPSIGYSFRIPQHPDLLDSVVKFRLNDTSRGIVDNYLLLYGADLDVPAAAIVVSRLPVPVLRLDSALRAVVSFEQQNAGPSASGMYSSQSYGIAGEQFDLFVPGRIGSGCFPTSTYRFAPQEDAGKYIEISRFIANENGDLVEFALVLKTEGKSRQDASRYASQMMDRFMRSLVRIPMPKADTAPLSGSVDAVHAVKMFQDYCLGQRSEPERFAAAMEKVGTRLTQDEAEPYMMGERGGAWRMRDTDYVFTITSLSRCRLHVLSPPDGDILKAFVKMATHPPQGMTSRKRTFSGDAGARNYLWSVDGAPSTARPTDLFVRRSLKQGLDPIATSWILGAEDYIGEAPIIMAPPSR